MIVTKSLTALSFLSDWYLKLKIPRFIHGIAYISRFEFSPISLK